MAHTEVRNALIKVANAIPSWEVLGTADREVLLFALVGVLGEYLSPSEYAALHHILVEFSAFHMRNSSGEFDDVEEERWQHNLDHMYALMGVSHGDEEPEHVRETVSGLPVGFPGVPTSAEITAMALNQYQSVGGRPVAQEDDDDLS